MPPWKVIMALDTTPQRGVNGLNGAAPALAIFQAGQRRANRWIKQSSLKCSSRFGKKSRKTKKTMRAFAG
jgi:hypothetical protein